ncbi:MAG TPA: flagellar hook-basal body complex protein, partial [Acidimicrobiales bacterium]|nr:flagellar hook-basal body complex protein [Acidimicrobiales bacterium]
MEQSLIAAVSGIEANQTYLDVVGNNIANANTTGYKSEDAVFTDLLAEQVAGASAPLPGGEGAGIDPIAIGSGVRIGAVTNDQSQGSLEQTNQPTDVAIQGDGFLVAEQEGQQLYTRAGHLTVDANGDLATPTGGLIQGWQASSTGVIDTNAPTTGLVIPSGEVMNAQATTTLDMQGNLPSWNGTGTPPVVTTTINGYDSLGDVVPVTLTLTGVAGQANQWSVAGTVPNGTGSTNLFSTTTPPVVTFDPTSGQISGITGVTANADGSYSLPVTTMPGNYTFPTGDNWSINFPPPGTVGDVTQFAGAQTFAAVNQDGNATGTLESYAIGPDGVITGSFSNGKTQALGEIALATFANPGGLTDEGDLMFAASPNSG